MRITLLLLVCCIASLNFFKVAGSPTSDKELDFEGGLFYLHFDKSLTVKNLTTDDKKNLLDNF